MTIDTLQPGDIVRYMGKYGMMAGYFVHIMPRSGDLVLDSPEVGKRVRVKPDAVLTIKRRSK